MTLMTQQFAAGIRHYTDTRKLDLAADPRDALIAAQAEQITVLEALVADLRKRLEAAERAGSRNSGNSSMPPSSDDLPGRKPPRGQRRAAERARSPVMAITTPCHPSPQVNGLNAYFPGPSAHRQRACCRAA
jgi:hypothetical protein